MGYRTCSTCKQDLPLEMFSKCSAEKLGRQYKCKTCDSLYQRERRQDKERYDKHKIRMRIRQYIRKYGLSEEEALSLVQDRVGECDICKQILPLEIDHCHTTGILRGRLCNACNTSLGLLKESIPSFKSAIQYLRRHQN
jgi:hypothetical protein